MFTFCILNPFNQRPVVLTTRSHVVELRVSERCLDYDEEV